MERLPMKGGVRTVRWGAERTWSQGTSTAQKNTLGTILGFTTSTKSQKAAFI